MSRRFTRVPDRRVIAGVIAALGIVGVLAGSAHAQRSRRPSAAQRAAAKRAQQQMQAYQRDVQRYQREMADKQAEIVQQHDENGDGRLQGPEKSKFDKYMFEVQKGRQPNPFAGIAPPGQGKDMTASTK